MNNLKTKNWSQGFKGKTTPYSNRGNLLQVKQPASKFSVRSAARELGRGRGADAVGPAQILSRLASIAHNPFAADLTESLLAGYKSSYSRTQTRNGRIGIHHDNNIRRTGKKKSTHGGLMTGLSSTQGRGGGGGGGGGDKRGPREIL